MTALAAERPLDWAVRTILPPLAAVLAPGAELVSLIKPQFEAGRSQAPGGVVRDPAVREAVVAAIRAFGEGHAGLQWLGVVPSPLLGPEGNVEFLAHWRKDRNQKPEVRSQKSEFNSES